MERAVPPLFLSFLYTFVFLFKTPLSPPPQPSPFWPLHSLLLISLLHLPRFFHGLTFLFFLLFCPLAFPPAQQRVNPITHVWIPTEGGEREKRGRQRTESVCVRVRLNAYDCVCLMQNSQMWSVWRNIIQCAIMECNVGVLLCLVLGIHLRGKVELVYFNSHWYLKAYFILSSTHWVKPKLCVLYTWYTAE